MTTSRYHAPPPLANIVASSQFDKAAYSAYEKVKSERDALKESENVYKKRNIVLENEKDELLKSYQGIYSENKILKSKVEHGPNAQRIRGFREEIKRLQDKVETLRAQISLLEDERGDILKKLNIATEEKKRLEDAYKMERSLHTDKRTDLENKNTILMEKVERLEKQNKEYAFRTEKCNDETEAMADRYKQVKVENMKIETKFRKQKNAIDEEIRDTKETNNEMAKEIIQLKLKQSKLESELHSKKIDCDAAQKQIEWQKRELEVFRDQTSHLKRNVKHQDRNYNRLEEDLKSAESMIDAAQTFGFDAVLHERKSIKRKENIHLKRIDALEMQVDELSRENAMLEKEATDNRMHVERLILENRNLEFAHSSMQRRMQVLEETNVELDKQGQYLKNKKGLLVTMGNQNVKNVEKEKQSLLSQMSFLEQRNRQMEKLINRLTNQPYRGTRDGVSIYTPTSKGSRPTIRLDLDSDNNPIVRRSKRTGGRASRSLPEIKK